MKKRLLIPVMFICASLLFAQGVRQSPPSVPTRTAVDANGRTLVLDGPVQNLLVVSKAAIMPANALFLFPEVEDMELSLSKTDQGLGDFFSLIRPELDQHGRLSQTASVEEIAARGADLVLMKSTHFESTAKKLDQLGVKNFTMSLETWPEWQAELVQLGALLGNPGRVQELLGLYQGRIEQIKERSAQLPSSHQKRVLLLKADRVDNTTSYKVAPDSWMQTWMVETSGAVPVWKGANKAAAGWSTVSFEQIAAWDPDMIVLISYSTPTASYLDPIYTSGIWAQLRAVKNREVFASPHDMMNYIQPVASWVLGLQWLAKTTYPELYTDLDMGEEVERFYRDFYAIEDPAIAARLVQMYTSSVATNSR